MVDAQILVGAALVDAEKHLLLVDGVGQRVEALHFGLAAHQPAVGAIHRLFDVFVGRGVLHALVKGHRDGGSEVGLYLHTLLGAHENTLAVDMRGKFYPFLGDLAQLRERKDLKSTAVGQDRAVPVHKLLQAAQIVYKGVAGAQMQVVGVGKFHPAVDLFQLDGRDPALDGGTGADVHEHGRFDIPVHRVQHAAAGLALFGFQLKMRHGFSFRYRENSPTQ